MNIKSQPEILVSGATGGVGSVAIQILRKIDMKISLLS